MDGRHHSWADIHEAMSIVPSKGETRQPKAPKRKLTRAEIAEKYPHQVTVTELKIGTRIYAFSVYCRSLTQSHIRRFALIETDTGMVWCFANPVDAKTFSERWAS